MERIRVACGSRECALVAAFLAASLLLGNLISENWAWRRGLETLHFRVKEAAPAKVTLQQLEHLRRSRASVARIRVLCWVLTGPASIKDKGGAVLATWGPRCDKLLFMTSAQDRSELAGRVSLPGVVEGRDGLVLKSQEAWRYVYEHYRNEYDWFYKCDDDTYTVVENLKFMLSMADAGKPTLLGKHLRESRFWRRVDWVAGGAGYVVNRLALALLKEQIDGGCMVNPGRPHEDQLVSLCLKKAGVPIGSDLDRFRRSRLLPLSPELHLAPGAIAKTKYKWVLSYSAGSNAENDGPTCCSDLAVSFHYVTPQAQHLLDDLVYDVHPFGTRLGDLRLQKPGRAALSTP